jgi:hypothetical protein
MPRPWWPPERNPPETTRPSHSAEPANRDTLYRRDRPIGETAHERRAAKLGSCTGDLPATFAAQQQAHKAAGNRTRCQSGLSVQQLAEIETGPTASLLFGLTALRARIQQLIEKRLGLVDHQDVLQFKPMPR